MSQRSNDNVNKRNQYKEELFDGKKSVIDDYSGKRIFKGNSSDMSKKHNISKTTDIDHITPITVVEKRYSDLKDSQIKKLANADYNYAATASSLNRSKGALENHQYLIREAKKGKPRDIKTTFRMSKHEANSRVRMRIQATGMRIQNISESLSETKVVETLKRETKAIHESTRQELADSVIPLTRSAVFEMCQVVSGEKDIKEASADIAKNAVEIAVQGGVNRLKNDVIETVMKSNSNLLSKIANSNAVLQIAEVAQIVKYSAERYLNGEIDGQEFIEEIGQNGTAMVAGIIGGQVGRELGQVIGGIIGTVALPGGGTLIGATIGSVVGEIVGSLVITAACSAIMTIRNELKNLDNYRKKEALISRIEHHALSEMEIQRNNIRAIIDEECAYWDREIEAGFDMIMQNACKNSYEGIAAGLDKILALFNSKVAFSTLDEYEDQLDSPLILNI